MNTLKTTGTKRRPVNLFFTELIIALLFFSISGAVILKVFAAADKKTRENAQKERAIICAQSIAEVYSELGNAEAALKTVFSDSVRFEETNERLVIKLDGDLNPALDGGVVLKASERREKTASGELSTLTVSFESENGELYELVCSAYLSENKAPKASNGGEP
ncbi:MAG: hypothetical protein K2J77_09145 [Oscillospiraceae bacterium]|nr:hypothetical protein [Oscillospiraceae bacterium]